MCEFWLYSCGHSKQTPCGVPKSNLEAVREETELFKKLSKYEINGPAAINESETDTQKENEAISPNTTPTLRAASTHKASTSAASASDSTNSSQISPTTTSTKPQLKCCTGFSQIPTKTADPCYACILKATGDQMAKERPLVEQMKLKRTGTGTDDFGVNSQGMVGYGQGGNSSWHGQRDNQNVGTRTGAASAGVKARESGLMQQQHIPMPVLQGYGSNTGMNLGIGCGPAAPYPEAGQYGMGNTNSNVNANMQYPVTGAGTGMSYNPTPMHPNILHQQYQQQQLHQPQYPQQHQVVPHPQGVQLPMQNPVMYPDMGMQNMPPGTMGAWQYGSDTGGDASSGNSAAQRQGQGRGHGRGYGAPT